MENKTRLYKAIDFFRKFSNKSDKDIYRRSVLKFCDLVESYIKLETPEKSQEEVFEDVEQKESVVNST